MAYLHKHQSVVGTRSFDKEEKIYPIMGCNGTYLILLIHTEQFHLSRLAARVTIVWLLV